MDGTSDLITTVLETMDSLVVALDPQGRITYFNRACEELTGYSREQVIGRVFRDFPSFEKYAEPVSETFTELAEGVKLPGRFEAPLRTKQGDERFIAWRSTVARDDQGRVTQVIGAGVDITERKRAEEALRQSEELYRSLVEATGSVVVRVDREGRRTFVGGDTVGLHRRPAEDLLRGRFGDNDMPENREKSWALLRETFETGKPVRGFVTRLKVGRGSKYISSNWEPIRDADGNVVEVQTTSTDITGQIETERRRMEAERLEALASMSGGIAHDVNNVLAMVMMWADIAQMKTVDPEVQEALGNIGKAAEDGAETMRRLRRFTEPRKAGVREPVDLRAIVAECVAFTRPMWKDQSEAKDIYIEVSEKLEEVPEVMGNAAELREAVVNLLRNAIEAMPKGGTLTVRTCREGDRARVAVSDTGVGIREDSLTRVFDPFYSTRGGSGLGLAAVRAVVTAQGGEVEVESGEGEGSTFIISLPIPEQDKQAEEEPTQAPRQGRLVGGLRYDILVVDDEPLVRKALESILEQQGHRVVTAEDGVGALKAFRGGDFDIVFLDLGMPRMNGYQVAEEMKKLKAQVPVVLVTGWGDDVDQERIASIGIAAVVGKPFHPQELLQTLEEVMKQG